MMKGINIMVILSLLVNLDIDENINCNLLYSTEFTCKSGNDEKHQ